MRAPKPPVELDPKAGEVFPYAEGNSGRPNW